MSATTPDEIVRTLAAFFEATSTSAVAVANASCTSVLRQKRHVHVVECAGEGTVASVASVVATDLLLKSLYSVRTLRVHELETAIAFTKRTIDMASHMFTVSDAARDTHRNIALWNVVAVPDLSHPYHNTCTCDGVRPLSLRGARSGKEGERKRARREGEGGDDEGGRERRERCRYSAAGGGEREGSGVDTRRRHCSDQRRQSS